MIKRMIEKLTDEEFKVLGKIIKKTGCDCWCNICISPLYESDYIWDLERKRRLTLRTGVACLCAALDCKENWNNCNLTNDEKDIFYGLCDDLDIIFIDWDN